MGERGFAIKADATKTAWESEEFPLLCESCLGENPYVRMMKEAYGSACKICARPFTVFRWKPGKRARYKKTEVCQTCARMKNVCQTCVLDLQYHLPVQVRDAVMAREEGGDQVAVNVPESDANREWFAQQHSRMLEQEGIVSAYGKTLGSANNALLRIARREPYYKRNRAHLCSFYAQGECNRGDECPYLHEMPREKDDPLARQNIKDRYFGKNDPVAVKMLGGQEGHDGRKDGKSKGSSLTLDGGLKPKPPPLPPGKKPPLPPGPPPIAAKLIQRDEIKD